MCCGFFDRCLVSPKQTIAFAFILPCVASTMFQYPVSKPCVMLKARFTVIALARYHSRIVAKTTLGENEVNKTSGLCSFRQTQLTLSYTDKGFVRFVFTRDTHGDKVVLNMEANFQPAVLFSGQISVQQGHTCFKHVAGGIGSDRQSYLCEIEQKYHYHRSACEEMEISATSPYTFSIELDVNNIHFQGFNIDQAVFSPSTNCEGDNYSKFILFVVVSFVALAVTVTAVYSLVLLLRRNSFCTRSQTRDTDSVS